MKWLPVALAVLMIGGAFQKEGKDFITNTDLGFRIFKPPRKEEWECKDKGTKFSNPQASINCRVKNLSIEVLVQATTNSQNYDLKKIVDADVNSTKSNENYKAVKVKSKKPMKFPATKDNAYYIEFEITDKNDKKFIIYEWVFISKTNRNIFKIFTVGDAAAYKKYKKDVFRVLGSFQTLKVKK